MVPNESDESGTEVHGGGGNGMAMRAMIIGSMILSAAEAAQEEGQEDSEFAPLFLAGALLMALGAYQAGQLLHSASKCCLRRLRSWCREDEVADLVRPESLCRRNQDVVVVSEEEEEDPNDSSGGRTEGGGSMAATSNKKMTRSGSGSVSSAGATSSVPLQRRSGSETSSMTLRPRSGSSSKGPLRLQSSPQSGSGDGASTLRSMPHSGFGASAAGEPAAEATSSSTSAAAGVGSVGVVSGSKGGTKGPRPSNPWNVFQHGLRGKGLNSTIMSKLYQDWSQ